MLSPTEEGVQEMMWWHGASGWDWWWMSLMMVAFWGAVAFAIYAIVRGWKGETHHHETPDEILARRFARGEISRQEYEESRMLLAS